MIISVPVQVFVERNLLTDIVSLATICFSPT